MGRAERRRSAAVDDVAAAVAGDERAWARVVDRHHRELHVHCYRMLGNFEEAEDAVQEVFLRAWRKRDAFDGGPHLRAWLYRIATNACLDVLRKKRRRVAAHGSYGEIGWLQPYPDRLLDEVVASEDDEPDVVAVARETIELAYLAALQVLPARQRAALILRDVLGWTAIEAAEALETTVPAANSALQRARATLQQELPRSRSQWATAEPSAEDREVLARFIDAHERGDAAASVALACADIRITMPPNPMCFDGIDGFAPLLERAFGAESEGEWKLVPTWANRQPAAASYLRRHGSTEWIPFKLDVIRVRDGAIAEITTFGWSLFPAFGLPSTPPE